MPTYKELKEKQQAEVNELPIYWAFDDRQWKNLLERLGLTEEQAKTELIGLFGGIVRKCDAKHILDTLARHGQEMQVAMKDLEFLSPLPFMRCATTSTESICKPTMTLSMHSALTLSTLTETSLLTAI